jgi:hypothetical protein
MLTAERCVINMDGEGSPSLPVRKASPRVLRRILHALDFASHISTSVGRWIQNEACDQRNPVAIESLDASPRDVSMMIRSIQGFDY